MEHGPIRDGSRKETLEQAEHGSGSAAPWAWRSSSIPPSSETLPGSDLDPPPPGPFPERFFQRDAAAVARDLLGSRFRSTVGNVRTEGVVVEAEAYLGPDDPASHAASRIGRTPRNEAMFGAPGTAYVFRSYGIHWCLNVVTGEVGFPAAVLIRALDPLAGREGMEARRGGKKPLCSGPGRLAQALDVTDALNGHILTRTPLELLQGWAVPEEQVVVSGRVGVTNAADWPLRFYLRGHPEVSRGPHQPLL